MGDAGIEKRGKWGGIINEMFQEIFQNLIDVRFQTEATELIHMKAHGGFQNTGDKMEDSTRFQKGEKKKKPTQRIRSRNAFGSFTKH